MTSCLQLSKSSFYYKMLRCWVAGNAQVAIFNTCRRCWEVVCNSASRHFIIRCWVELPATQQEVILIQNVQMSELTVIQQVTFLNNMLRYEVGNMTFRHQIKTESLQLRKSASRMAILSFRKQIVSKICNDPFVLPYSYDYCMVTFNNWLATCFLTKTSLTAMTIF